MPNTVSRCRRRANPTSRATSATWTWSSAATTSTSAWATCSGWRSPSSPTGWCGRWRTRLRVVYESALGEVELWNKSAAAQLDAQLRERRRNFGRRIEAIERIQQAATRPGRPHRRDRDRSKRRIDELDAKLAELTDHLVEHRPPRGHAPAEPAAAARHERLHRRALPAAWCAGSGRTGATACPGRTRATPIASGSPKSCCSRRRWPTVLDYYARFLARFPDVTALAAAPTGRGAWACGAAWATTAGRATCTAARRKSWRCIGGEFPRSAQVLQTLPGIGRSTAAAIAVVLLRRARRHPGRQRQAGAHAGAGLRRRPRRRAQRTRAVGRRRPSCCRRRAVQRSHAALHAGPDGPGRRPSACRASRAACSARCSELCVGAAAKARPRTTRSRPASSSAARSRSGCCCARRRDGSRVAGKAARARHLGRACIACRCSTAAMRWRPLARRRAGRACATTRRSSTCSRTRICTCIRWRSQLRARHALRGEARRLVRSATNGRRPGIAGAGAQAAAKPAESCRRSSGPSSSRCRLSAIQRAPNARGQLLHQEHRAVLAAGAADGHRHVAAVVARQRLQPVVEELLDVAVHLLHVGVLRAGTRSPAASRPVRSRSAGS